ncbi:hypothetical protein H0H93_009576 [Arthromyces matolae]|nr:hypothetical protein H0H93_009576 [Arthromyces matolae]
MTLPTAQLQNILATLHSYSATVSDFIITLLQDADFADSTTIEEMGRRIDEILDAMRHNPVTKPNLMKWASNEIQKTYALEILTLAKKSMGLQFGARTATVEKLEALSIDFIAEEMKKISPELWELVGVLLQADPDRNKRRTQARVRYAKKKGSKANTDAEGDVEMNDASEAEADTEEKLWEDLEDLTDIINSDGIDDLADNLPGDDKTENNLEELEEREEALMTITVIELMAHLGVSISTTAINLAVSSLSRESYRELQRLGSTLLTSYAYDNVDIDLKSTVPTMEKPGPTLIHLTSATLIPLEHNVTADDLDCAQKLWENSSLNRHRVSSQVKNIHDSDLARLHPDSTRGSSSLNRRERYNAWVFLRDLIQHGPDSFKKYKSQLESPELIDAIPVVKYHQVHARMMDTACATPAENASVIEDLLSKQGGVGDASKDPHLVNIGNQVIIMYGDLGVGERIQSLMASRAEERTPFRRMQFIVYGLGLFHVKMACADAIWRMFIFKPESRKESDDHSLMKHISILRPKETRKFETKPGFRRMHEIIQDVGAVSRLDCWRLEAKKLGFSSLKKYGESKPTFDEVKELAGRMAQTYVARKDFESLRSRRPDLRDEIEENMKLRQQYFLLYDEMSTKMNYGDIGGVEACFLPWIWLFQACGKHKYATFMRKYLRDVHFVYPEGVRGAVRKNILVNPTGRPGRFRGVDWWVEHNNFYIKRIYGGKFSNHTKHHILKESPLIGIFKNTRIQVENMFRMVNKTTRHSRPDMTKSYAKLTTHLEETKNNAVIPGRTTKYQVPNYLLRGQHLASTQKDTVIRGEYYSDAAEGWEDLGDGEDEAEELDDFEVNE